jgi:hypothetical protein
MTEELQCFKPYARTCSRIHFFNIDFTKTDFDGLLMGTPANIDEATLHNSYLGFVVVKPLPQTIVGRSCLKTYELDNGRRNFPTTREYKANIYGIELTIDSLAYQEQDSVVAACATSALWSVFHHTGIQFQHPILSPVDITKAACAHLPLETRAFPNKGLTAAQMAHAIRNVGLEPFLINATDKQVLKSALYAYLKLGVPILMGIGLYDFSGPDPEFVGDHAVAVTGFSLGYPGAIPFNPRSGFLLKASRVDKVYAHDDQVGPFARMALDQPAIQLNISGTPKSIDTIGTSWIGKNKTIGSIRAVPKIILIPLYHKIRITFQNIQALIIYFDGLLEVMKAGGIFSLPHRIEWDIYLTSINQFKTNILHLTCLKRELKHQILIESMPRFLWRATARSGDNYVLDLLFDATDIEQGSFLVRAIGYNEEVFNGLVETSKDPSFKTKPEWRILQWFSKI